MKKIWKRIFAYTIDLIVLVLLASIISNIKVINPQLDDYNKYYKELIKVNEEYNNFINDIEKYYKNEELNETNYQKLINDYSKFKEILNKYYEDSKLEKTEYNKLLNEIKNNYQKKYIQLNYKLEKNSVINYAIYLILTILYFGIFNIITKGQTLGKKITSLKIIKKDGTEPNIINYILRSILLYNSVYYIVSIIGSYTLNQNNFYTVSNITYQIQYYLQWIIIFMTMVRVDGRGLHDFIGNTKVVALDKEGNIIEEEPIFSLNENTTKKESNKEIENKNKNKVIDTTIEEKE